MKFFADLGRGIKAVFKGPASKDNLFNLDHRTSLREAIPFGLQHVLAMFAANIMPIVIVFTTIGLFGSLVYFGNMIGSIIVFKIIDEYNRKFLLNLSFLINSICLLSFTYFENIPFLFLNRIITGMFQSFINIYLPVWANAFGEKNKRTMMIAEIQLMSPIGIFLGYLIAAIFINNDPVDKQGSNVVKNPTLPKQENTSNK